MKLDKSTISKDFKRLRQKAKDEIRKYIEDVLPLEHQKALIALNEVIKQAWAIAQKHNEDPQVMLKVLSVISDATMKRAELLGDPQYIEQAIKTVASLRSKISRQKENADEQQDTSEQLEQVMPADEADS